MEPTWTQQHAGLVVVGCIGVFAIAIVALVVVVNGRQKRLEREAEVASIVEAPLMGNAFDTMRGVVFGAIVGAVVAVVLIVTRGVVTDLRQFIAVPLFAAGFAGIGRVVSLVPIRRGTLRIDKTARVLTATLGVDHAAIDLGRPFSLGRFRTLPGLPYSAGLMGARIAQESIELRLAWPITVLEIAEGEFLSGRVATWVTDRRGKAIVQHLAHLAAGP